MATQVKLFFLLTASFTLLNCIDDFSTYLHPDKLSEEDEIWLNDSDSNGVADSLDKYAKDCGYTTEACLKIAKDNKKGEVTRIQDSLKHAIVEFSPPGGQYYTEILVTLATAGNGVIRYTTNGTTPSEESKAYNGPIPIIVFTVLKARSFSKSNDAGPVQSAEYKLKVDSLYATKQSGEYTGPIKIAFGCKNDKAKILYTLDGSIPSDSSKPFKDSLEIFFPTTIKAQAFREGWISSDILEVRYKINFPGIAGAPAFIPKGGAYPEPQEVGIVSETKEAEIRYTLDGKDPDSSSRLYSDKISVDKGMTIKAVAMKNGLKISPVSEAEFTITISGTASAPTFLPKGGAYPEPQEVGITSETKGAEIRYTLDGRDPDSSSKLYSDKISVDKGMTIKAVAMKTGLKTSPVSVAEFTIKIPGTTAAPAFIPKGGTYSEPQQVTITSETVDAEIRYTIDGTAPNASSARYSEKIQVDSGMTIMAIAMKEGEKTSAPASAKYILKTSVPKVMPSAGDYDKELSVVISVKSPEGAEIYYTTNGQIPTKSSEKYKDTILVAESMTIKARAFYKNWEPSQTAEVLYNLQIPDKGPPQNNTTLTGSQVSDGIALTWTTPVSIDARVDTVGIWVRDDTYPDSSRNGTLVGYFSDGVSTYTWPADTTATYNFTLLTRDSSGIWSDTAGAAQTSVDFIGPFPVAAKKITMNAAAAGVTRDEKDFPLLVRLTGASFFTSSTGDGRDIRFLDSNATDTLYHEIERWDSSGAAAEVWVRVPTLYGSRNDQFILMNYGNDSLASASLPESVFTVAKGFGGVWHLGESSGPSRDATENSNDGSFDLGTAQPGAVGLSQFLDGTQFDSIPDHGSIRLGSSDFTISGWAKTTSTSYKSTILAKGTGWAGGKKAILAFKGEGNLDINTDDDTNTCEITSADSTYVDGNWHLVYGVRDNDVLRLYIDGTAEGRIGDMSSIGSLDIANRGFTIGALIDETNNRGSEQMKGNIDEVRLSTTARSKNWIKLCYETQKPGAVFNTISDTTLIVSGAAHMD